MTEQATREYIYELYRKGDWKSMIDYPRLPESQLMWIQPQTEHLNFIQKIVADRKMARIVSVGAGCGLFEWLLGAATGMEVIGLEIDPNWWKSPYSPLVFVPLVYQDTVEFQQLARDKNSALLFCYFNNGPAFHDYLKNYEGNVVILIGPDKSGVHTDPAPFDLQNHSSNWTLYSSKRITRSQDIIVVYVRTDNN